MTYSFFLLHPTVREHVEQGKEIDHPPLVCAAVERFVGKLLEYEYICEAQTPESREFVKEIDGCPIQVIVFTTETFFDIPYWDNCGEAIFEALMDAREIAESEHFVLYDPQNLETPFVDL